MISTVNLYDLLLGGDARGDARLQLGSVIFMPPIGATMGIAGEAKRPAIYELKDDKTLSESLAFAGGLLPAYPQDDLLERVDDLGEFYLTKCPAVGGRSQRQCAARLLSTQQDA